MLALAVAGCAAASGTPGPVTVTGSGNLTTKPFDLAAGDYRVTLTGATEASLDLHGGIAPHERPIADGILLYELDAATYDLKVIASDGWVVTLTPVGRAS